METGNAKTREHPIPPTPYLRKKGTDEIFAYGAGIAMRTDMEPYDGPIHVTPPKTTFEEGAALAKEAIAKANAQAEEDAVDSARMIIEEAQKEAARIIAEAKAQAVTPQNVETLPDVNAGKEALTAEEEADKVLNEAKKRRK